MDARKKAIFAFQSVKPILQTITNLTQGTVLRIKFWSVKCTTATVPYPKISSIFIPSHLLIKGKQLQWPMVRLYENKPLQNAFKLI